MADLISLADVQQWIDGDKLTISALDEELVTTWTAFVKSKLAQRYDVSTWTNSTNTPGPVKIALSMLVAFGYHERYYSENIESGEGVMTYGQRLKTEAFVFIDDMVEGRATVLGL